MDITIQQITTLLYFAQNYTIKEIAQIRAVSIRTIETQLSKLRINHSEYYNNAVSMRNASKRTKFELQHPSSLHDIDEDNEPIIDIE